jgi:Tol biopolymer transport system component
MFVVAADGSEPPVPVGAPFVDGGTLIAAPTWTPDGRFLLYHADARADGIFELYMVEPERSSVAIVLSVPLGSESDVGTYACSPDSTMVAFTADVAADNRFDLFTRSLLAIEDPIAVSGTMVSGASVTRFVWGPDSERLAFLADRALDERVDAWVTDARDGRPILVAQPSSIDGDVESVGWSSDGRRLFVAGDLERLGIDELFVTHPSGAVSPVRVSADMVAGGDVDVGNRHPVWTRTSN